ncbi:Glutamate decarboxylase [Folsomia candida]|uniref:Glutamate decarboxylase n=2 Tax=Folsomia candida TaxID=158441 RepID=A0A226EHV7_FOLCA|nr:Glutamate decarboxylase [Folsomia candida]
MKLMDFSLPDEPRNLAEILQDCETTLKHVVRTGHPHFFNQLSNGLDTMSLAGEFITATANTNMFTYEIAPVFILMEKFVFRKMREIIGYTRGDTIMAPGGSISNLYAVIVARHCMFPDYKKQGMRSMVKEPIIFTSEHSHYSIMKAAVVAGFGTEHCVNVPCDQRGKMIPEELERLVVKAKEAGSQPFFVTAMGGSTVFGAFDPINDIADICDKHNLWLHIDGAWGGSLLLSKKYRQGRFDGVERARSLTWNPHKLLTTSLQCSTVHFKEKGHLASCNSTHAAYLFQPDKHYDVRYDTGDKVIQCGRRNDIYKLWLKWRAHGTSGLEKAIDHMMGVTEYMVACLKSHPDKFYLIVEEPECTNVCFWYIPERYRNQPHSAEKQEILGKVTLQLKRRMMEKGTLMISYQPQGKIPNFFRNIISNPAVQKDDIDFLIDELDRLGRDL